MAIRNTEFRDGTPLDFRDVDVSNLILPLSRTSVYIKLNNPYQGRPAQIADVGADGLAFRYTLGATEPEWFPIQATSIGAINDDGAFCGDKFVQLKGGKSAYLSPSGMTTSTASSCCWQIPSRRRLPIDMNRDRDLITSGRKLSRRLERWVALDTLLVGTSTDVALWNSDSRGFCYGHV